MLDQTGSTCYIWAFSTKKSQLKTRFAQYACLATLISHCSAITCWADSESEDYAAFPVVSLVTLSRDGNRLAWRRTGKDVDTIAVYDLEKNESLTEAAFAANLAQRLDWIDERYLAIGAVRSRRSVDFLADLEESDTVVVDTMTGETRVIRRSWPWESTKFGGFNARTVIGANLETGEFFLRGADLYHARVAGRGSGVTVFRGTSGTIDWITNEDGSPLIREDFHERFDRHQIWAYDGVLPYLFYERTSEAPLFRLAGTNAARDGIWVLEWSDATNARNLRLIDLESGDKSEPALRHPEKTVARVLTTLDRVVLGVEYAGFRPTYDFFDGELTQRVRKLQALFPGASVRIVSWDDGLERLVLYVTNSEIYGQYFLASIPGKDLVPLAESHPKIPTDSVAPFDVISYQAADGLVIPALLTASQQTRRKRPAPLVVLAPSQPAIFQSVEYRWLSQFLASRGYVVLQPQIRGSAAFGYDLLKAGFGEWAGLMQADIDDGIAYLVEDGIADPDRVCIVGLEHGSYRALWAAIRSRKPLACVVSVNAVTDLHAMVKEHRREYGDQVTETYWERFFGVSTRDSRALDALSPLELADRIDTPVLLVHDRHNELFKDWHSEAIYDELQRDSKNARLALIDGDGRSINDSRSRVEVLREIDGFLSEHLRIHE